MELKDGVTIPDSLIYHTIAQNTPKYQAELLASVLALIKYLYPNDEYLDYLANIGDSLNVHVYTAICEIKKSYDTKMKEIREARRK